MLGRPINIYRLAGPLELSFRGHSFRSTQQSKTFTRISIRLLGASKAMNSVFEVIAFVAPSSLIEIRVKVFLYLAGLPRDWAPCSCAI